MHLAMREPVDAGPLVSPSAAPMTPLNGLQLQSNGVTLLIRRCKSSPPRLKVCWLRTRLLPVPVWEMCITPFSLLAMARLISVGLFLVWGSSAEWIMFLVEHLAWQRRRSRFALSRLSMALLVRWTAMSAVFAGAAMALARLLVSQVCASSSFNMLALRISRFSKLQVSSLTAATGLMLWCARRTSLKVLCAQSMTALGAMTALLLAILDWSILISRCVAPQEQAATTLLLLPLYKGL